MMQRFSARALRLTVVGEVVELEVWAADEQEAVRKLSASCACADARDAREWKRDHKRTLAMRLADVARVVSNPDQECDR